jgi:excinuclease UvrABC nuclease subunit
LKKWEIQAKIEDMEKFRFLKKNKISRFPKAPGVYAFKKGRKFLYIGKAANLQERIKGHPRLLKLAGQLGYIKTKSEIKALILEAELIKKHRPKYNVAWRDDKNYFYVGMTKKPCLWFDLGQCPAPCLFQSQRIEAYDISDIQGQQATGAMVTFIKGKPDKNLYRRFKIKIAGKPNDVAMIKEVLSRRCQHAEWGWPDLILIDGGQAQLNAAISITKIPVMALAKKENKLYIKNQPNPVLLKSLPREIFNLILQLRDEAHRFAKKYHLHLREKALLN